MSDQLLFVTSTVAPISPASAFAGRCVEPADAQATTPTVMTAMAIPELRRHIVCLLDATRSQEDCSLQPDHQIRLRGARHRRREQGQVPCRDMTQSVPT